MEAHSKIDRERERERAFYRKKTGDLYGGKEVAFLWPSPSNEGHRDLLVLVGTFLMPPHSA